MIFLSLDLVLAFNYYQEVFNTTKDRDKHCRKHLIKRLRRYLNVPLGKEGGGGIKAKNGYKERKRKL